MQGFRGVASVMLALTIAVSASAQSRGSLRVAGKVTDEAGKPVAAAQVRAAKKGEIKPESFTATTDEKGEYALNGLEAGDWVIEAAKEGLGGGLAAAALVEGERTTTVNITIAKPAAPAVDPSVEIAAEDKRAVELAQAGKIAERARSTRTCS